MKTLAIIACTIACFANGKETKDELIPTLNLPAPLSPAEAAALEAKEKQERAEAKGKLPHFDADRLEHILKVLREVTYPVSFDTLRDKLGGPDSLVWCCTLNRIGNEFKKQSSVFSVAADALEYELVVDYEDSPVGQRPTMVGRAKLCYNSPFGWRFTAESMDDRLQVGVRDKKPNQTSGPAHVNALVVK